MKHKFHLTVLFSCLAFARMSYAQNAMPDLVGIWEIQGNKVVTDKGEALALFHTLKVLYADSTFSNVVLTPKSSLISLTGKFNADDKGNYTEKASKNNFDFIKVDLNGEQKLTYKLSADKQFLTLEGTLKDKSGNAFKLTEVWKRIVPKG